MGRLFRSPILASSHCHNHHMAHQQMASDLPDRLSSFYYSPTRRRDDIALIQLFGQRVTLSQCCKPFMIDVQKTDGWSCISVEDVSLVSKFSHVVLCPSSTECAGGDVGLCYGSPISQYLCDPGLFHYLVIFSASNMGILKYVFGQIR